MVTDIGEYAVGAYLKIELNCDVLDYNVRPPGGGMAGLAEFDVLGFNFSARTAYLCEVTTHLRGLTYGQGTRTPLSESARSISGNRNTQSSI